MNKKLIVTHHAPDLDAIGAVWILKKFDSQHYADAHISFVNPGETIDESEIKALGFRSQDTTHVDTGLGQFDHHQPERGELQISATSLVYDHVIKLHPELKNDKALAEISRFITQIDHFQEIHWPEANDNRYIFMIHNLIRGMEFFEPHNDDSQLHFGMTCLNCAYASLTQKLRAEEIIFDKGEEFVIGQGKCLAIQTRNDDTIKCAQKQGYILVVRKDPKHGHIRIKIRPDTNFSLKKLHELILKKDSKGTWFYHASGKMLINGSIKHRNQTPSPLSLGEVVALIKETYG